MHRHWYRTDTGHTPTHKIATDTTTPITLYMAVHGFQHLTARRQGVSISVEIFSGEEKLIS